MPPPPQNQMDYLLLILCSVFALASGSSRTLPISSFDEGFAHLFGDNNMQVLKDGKFVHFFLDQTTGSGFLLHDLFLH
ncbi:putative xyloglucan:xyloglucosyl transferase [Helianthus annuus]|nr:putative xyloglucan:xyloglucosyl transferase [Helianthus annuus]